MKILVDGGAGYVGSALVPELLADGHEVTVFDIGWFGFDFLPKHEKLEIIKGDIRDERAYREACRAKDAVIHLACVSNDGSCQLDPALSTTINYDCFPAMVRAAYSAGVRRYIYCSSSSVYGTSEAPDVREDHPLKPLTLYNKYKGLCEPILMERASERFICTILRPATVCGPAPRMRFDLTANVLTRDAIVKRRITVHGGQQRRPSLDIRDMCRVYREVLAAPEPAVQREIFNVGDANLTVLDTAMRVRQVVEEEMPGPPIEIDVEPRQDNRSYHINSEKILGMIGFRAKYRMEDAAREICREFRKGRFQDAMENPAYTNVIQLMGFGLGRSAAKG